MRGWKIRDLKRKESIIMGFIDVIKDRARADKKVIVLPESED